MLVLFFLLVVVIVSEEVLPERTTRLVGFGLLWARSTFVDVAHRDPPTRDSGRFHGQWLFGTFCLFCLGILDGHDYQEPDLAKGYKNARPCTHVLRPTNACRWWRPLAACSGVPALGRARAVSRELTLPTTLTRPCPFRSSPRRRRCPHPRLRLARLTWRRSQPRPACGVVLCRRRRDKTAHRGFGAGQANKSDGLSASGGGGCWVFNAFAPFRVSAHTYVSSKQQL